MSKFQIDPKTQMMIAIIVGLLALAAKGTVALPMGIPPIVGEYITSWSNFLIQIWLLVLAPLLPAFSSSAPGPLAPPDPPSVVEAEKAAAIKPD